ncbi:MAG: hypothetical protein LBN94_00760 [Puniceicoccales bacterium]|jgi:hypothetical protein|nr:hypothetical protein [Puniceicoccales bacterium]
MSILSFNSFSNIDLTDRGDVTVKNSMILYNKLLRFAKNVNKEGGEGNVSGIFQVGDVTYDVKIKKDAENKPQVTINRLDGRRAATQVSAEEFSKKTMKAENNIDEKVDDEDEYIIDISNHLYEAISEDFSRLEQEKASSASTSGEIPPPPPQP